MPPSTSQTSGYTNEKWLAIVGVGEGGAEDLGEAAKRLIGGADFVFGGARHIALAGALIRGEAIQWPSPFDADMRAVREKKPRRVCALASGDPFSHGVGATLARVVPPREMIVLPAPSAFSLAGARLGWALRDVLTISLHGKSTALLRPYLAPGARVLALTSDGNGPGEIAALLMEHGFGGSVLHVLEALGGPRERHVESRAADTAGEIFDPLNVVGIEVVAAPNARIIPLTPGLADGFFDHDGQITKREIRALTLSALAPRRGELLIDIGAGSGSVSIEWMLADPSLRAIAIEADGARAARIGGNARALGVPGLRVIHARAPSALEGLPPPDAVFIGGGCDGLTLDASANLLRAGGRLVVNAVTLETQALLIARHAALGGGLIRVAVDRAAPVGRKRGWRPAMPVTQWAWVKP